MSKLKLWRYFSLLMVLLLIASLAAVVPARPVQASVSSITVNPYDTAIIGLNTGYRITMTAGASLNAGDTIIISFPTGTTVPDLSGTPGNVFVKGIPCSTVSVFGQQVTVTIPTVAPIVPGQQFTVTFNKACGITNPTASGLKTLTVGTSVEPTPVTSSSYEITAVKVYTGATKHNENATITGAIAAAILNDTITVPAGTYNTASGESFPLLLNQALTIKSLSGASATIIQPTSDNLSAFDVTAANVTIGGSGAGFTILPGGRGGIYADTNGSSGITVQGCIFKSTSDGASRGMWFENLSNNALISGNSFATPKLGTGIQVINANGATISNNTVATGTLFYCFLTFKAEAFYPDRNLATPYSEYVATAPSTINDVSVTGNSITGIGDIGQSRQAIRFAVSTKPSDHGEPQAQDLTVGSSGVTISGNTFTNNNGQAVKIDADKPAPGAPSQIAHIYGAGNIHINNNNFTGNTIVGVDNGTTTIVDAKQNYWGNASGPSHDSLPYGDTVSTNVTFKPWLVAAYTGTPPAGDIAISTASPLPDGTTGVAYSTPLLATGGSGTYTWAYYSLLATRPPGLSFAGSSFSGTPTQVNIPGFNFDVQVNDGIQGTYKNFLLSVSAGLPVITTTSPLPGGTINVPYGPVQLQATGGDGTYAWSLYSGTWPTGLTSLGSNGIISGTPTAAGTFNFRVRVLSGGQFGYKDLSITISAAPSVGQKLIGMDDATPSGYGGVGYQMLNRFLAVASDNMTGFRVKCNVNSTISYAVYTDNNTSPGARLAQQATPQSCIAGWNTLAIDPVSLTTGNYYWLSVYVATGV